MFINFFENLRSKGLKVTLGEWLTLQEALDKGLCGSSLTGFYYVARMILVKSETDFDKFDMAFEECFKAAGHETEVGAEMLRWLDKSDMMELAHEEARNHLNQMEDIQVDKEDVEEKFRQRLKEFAAMKKEYTKVLDAVNMVRMKGYGVVTPDKEEIVLDKPELIKHGNKFGVKIKAFSPSIHMIRANIETEIAPIVGTKEQADDLIRYINQAEMDQGIWDTNIFGKTVEQLVNDGISSKVAAIGDESQAKLQDTMQKIVNDSNGGMICIII